MLVWRALLTLLPVYAQLCAKKGRTKQMHMQDQGIQREAVIYVPPVTVPQTRFPMWLVLAGEGQSTEEFLADTGLLLFTAQHGIAFVALSGSQPDGFNIGSGCAVKKTGANELTFINRVLVMMDIPCIDKQRIFCTGFSSGGRMCMRLASDLSLVFAAVAAVEGMPGVVIGLRFPASNVAVRPMPLLALHGADDKIYPWKGDGDASNKWTKGIVTLDRDQAEISTSIATSVTSLSTTQAWPANIAATLTSTLTPTLKSTLTTARFMATGTASTGEEKEVEDSKRK
eukprot:g3566.t1